MRSNERKRRCAVHGSQRKASNSLWLKRRAEPIPRRYSPSQRKRWRSKTAQTQRRPSPSRSARRRSQDAGRQNSWGGRPRRRTPYTRRSPERRTWSGRTHSTRATGERREEKGGTGLTAAIQESFKKLEARLNSRLTAMGPQLRELTCADLN